MRVYGSIDGGKLRKHKRVFSYKSIKINRSKWVIILQSSIKIKDNKD